ncbi:hypothetical protein CAAN1_06S05952 [[Candida] anglica]|uniref:Rad60/SUMO-like domain-containing protein n=1 Tax=[Candida] anglica TaxID=148631 RepID=A0ABP0EL07_9ASCO
MSDLPASESNVSEYYSATEKLADEEYSSEDLAIVDSSLIKINTIVRAPQSSEVIVITDSETEDANEEADIVDVQSDFENELLKTGFSSQTLASAHPTTPPQDNQSSAMGNISEQKEDLLQEDKKLSIDIPPPSTNIEEQLHTPLHDVQMDEKIEEEKLPHETSKQTIKTSPNASTSKSNSLSPKSAKKKRPHALMDDFFAIGNPEETKKKKKKSKRKSVHEEVNVKPEEPMNLTPQPSVDLDGSKTEATIKKPSVSTRTRSLRSDNIEENKVKDTHKNNTHKNNIVLDDEDDDDLTLDLEIYKPSSPQSTSSAYQFSDANESKRVYNLSLISELDQTSESYYENELQVQGTIKFSHILDITLTNINKGSSIEYHPEDVSLIWVEGRTEIKPFFKPSTLRIEPEATFLSPDDNVKVPPTKIKILLIPRVTASSFLTSYPQYFHMMSATSQYLVEDARKTLAATSDIDISDVESDNDNEISNEMEATTQVTDEQPQGEYFVIGLKGKDNKRIEVSVCPTTPIIKVLEYFLKKKNIDSNSVDLGSVKLIFDDEELDIDSKIEDTELEEDFEVQVVL